jgi:hypothetical protein
MAKKKPIQPARRGRPPTGRKTVMQVPMDEDDASAVREFADAEGMYVADVLRGLIKGELQWSKINRGR